MYNVFSFSILFYRLHLFKSHDLALSKTFLLLDLPRPLTRLPFRDLVGPDLVRDDGVILV